MQWNGLGGNEMKSMSLICPQRLFHKFSGLEINACAGTCLVCVTQNGSYHSSSEERTLDYRIIHISKSWTLGRLILWRTTRTCRIGFLSLSGLTRHQNKMHPLPNNQLLPALLPPPEFFPPLDDMYFNDGENNPPPNNMYFDEGENNPRPHEEW